jgi:uncharacterized protein
MVMTELPARKVPDIQWDIFNEAIGELADKIRGNPPDNSNIPDIIIPIARGGIAPGCFLAYALNVRRLASILVGEEGVVTMGTQLDLRGKKAMLVIDVIKTGRTLAAAKDYLVSEGAIVKTVCLYTSPESEMQPDYSLGVVQSVPILPYEKDAPI